MKEKQAAKKKLAELLEEFTRLDQSGSLKGQSEATARTWVERFLGVFGWDCSDPRQVRQEYRIQGRAARRLKTEETTHRRPDYCLLSNGQRLLYIDVKKFDANLKDDSGIAYQVRCYGWSEGFKVSYAFDFEEMSFYDCRIRPQDSDDAHVARIFYLNHHQYMEHFEDLWDFFSKQAIDAGSLSKRLPDDQKPRGSKTLDQDFEEKLSAWRKELAKSILRYGKERKPELLSAAAQRILDRVIFLRICEELGFEEQGSLLEMGMHEDGFWPLFLEQHEKRYCKIYDGILFPASDEDDPTGVEAHLRSWWLKGRVFRDIVTTLYFPHPYRFDVVPLELLGGIYERYLGKRLRVVGNEVEDEFKQEHQRTKGAVYTPLWVVRRVVEKTLGRITDGMDPDRILSFRVLDLACGSAGFLLGVYDFLEKRILEWFVRHRTDGRFEQYVIQAEDGPRLHPDISRRLINECLYGVDIDSEAVEVARMSLALHYLERTAPVSSEPNLLLKGIGLNIRQGNSLIGPDIVGLGIGAEKIISEVMPFDWHSKTTGFGVVIADGGFDAVVGNPPYIEVKRYKEWMPAQYKYLKESGVYETTEQGKTDIAMPFMEQGLRLLKKGGKLGFIIQNRFFKTDYGASVRAWLRRNRAVEEIEDFRDLQVFSGRTTYTAILILRKESPSFRYRTFASIEDATGDRSSVSAVLKWTDVDDGVWSFDQPDLMTVHRDLALRHGTIGSHSELQISVGLQTLWGRLYQFDTVEVKPRTVIGKNGEGETVSLERAALRPLCRNRGFHPFRKNNADAWVIFPYDVKGSEAFEIGWREFKERFPKTAAYLEQRKKMISKSVEVEDGINRWHLYTRPQNLVIQAMPKVLFPMTIEDVMSSVDEVGDIYQDNVNINSISFPNISVNQLLSISAVFNSSIFNALARMKAGLNDSGWRKFNRQYAELVPFPVAIYKDERVVNKLSAIASQICGFQNRILDVKGEGARSGLRATLESLWQKLDDAVEDVYGISDAQKAVIRRYPRRVNRFDLLIRQTTDPENDED